MTIVCPYLRGYSGGEEVESPSIIIETPWEALGRKLGGADFGTA